MSQDNLVVPGLCESSLHNCTDPQEDSKSFGISHNMRRLLHAAEDGLVHGLIFIVSSTKNNGVYRGSRVLKEYEVFAAME